LVTFREEPHVVFPIILNDKNVLVKMGGIGIIGESEAYFWIRFEYRDPMGSIILGRLRCHTDGKQEITFYPTSLGVYRADARSKGEPLKGSPLFLEVVPEISLTIPRNQTKKWYLVE